MASKRNSTLGALIESFFDQRLIQQQQASPATVSTYKDALRLLLSFASEKLGKTVDQLEMLDLDYELVLEFLEFLEQKRGNSVRSRNARLAAIHSFMRHVAFRDPTALGLAQRILSISRKRTVSRVVDFLRPPEVDALLKAPNRLTRQGRRDYALLLFLLRTGARVSETIGVNADDLHLAAPHQVLIRGKGSKERLLPMPSDIASVLRSLLDEQRINGIHPPVFVNGQNARLTRFGVTHVVRRAVRQAAPQCISLAERSVSPHSFRHTAAMRLLQAGVDITVIRSWLGHSDIQTTHGYLEADVEMKRQALSALETDHETIPIYQAPSAVLALLES